jgi:predicted ATPase
MFTDIEGSTRLLERLGDEYGSLLRDHHRLVLAAIEDNGGVLVDTQGDACFAAFATAGAAVAGAAEAQRALAIHPWPGEAEVLVRMGLHTGSPVPMDDRYVGMDVHRAARIAASARGGQVLASSSTVELTDDDRAGWTFLGRYRLKDLKRPESLHQLRWDGLREAFPPLSAPRWGNDLPQPPTRFVGRVDEVEALGRAIGEDGARLVTLVGPGGIGKTRLAVQVATTLSERFADGAAFVPLATLQDSSEIGPAIAIAVEAPEPAGDDPAAALVEHLHDQHVLLVLDNLEHLPESGAVVSSLLAGSSDVHVLATSRSPLGIYGERLVPVTPLATQDGDDSNRPSEAVALFLDRASSMGAGVGTDRQTLSIVGEICRRLDGIPLAIELAAAKASVISPADLLDRLRLEILTGGPRDLDARQQTLQATIDWSHRLLDAADRAVFRRLSVFAGGAGLEAAEQVADPDGDLDVLDRLHSLIAQSLVWRGDDTAGSTRFRMLETIREFALAQLERAGESDEVHERQATHLLGFLRTANEHLDGAGAAEWFTRIEQEMPNLRIALRWALEEEGRVELGIDLADALGWFWYVRGDAHEALRWLSLAGSYDSPPAKRVRLVYYAAAMQERLGRLRDAAAAFEDALSMFRELGDRNRVARTLNSLGGLAVDLGDLDSAVGHLEEAERILLEEGDEYGRAVSLVNLCDAAVAAGDLDRAEAFGRSSVDLFTALDNDWGVASGLRHLAKVSFARDDLEGARLRLQEALRAGREVGDRSATVRCVERLAGIAIRLGETVVGTRLAAASQRLRRELGDPLTPERREPFEAGWRDARTVLGDERFEEVWAQGQSMTADQALDYATGDRLST